MQVRPERLGMCEERVKPGDAWRGPEVSGRPAVREELRGRAKRKGRGGKERERVNEEETAVRSDL